MRFLSYTNIDECASGIIEIYQGYIKGKRNLDTYLVWNSMQGMYLKRKKSEQSDYG